ncbi:MAG: hypothetical protein JXK05_05410 [Campylobacterales bacterium]|nr:hypothetical protein [Campylobacterales bacterium]
MRVIVAAYVKIRFMQISAKILFYNPNDGKGIVITLERQKYEFVIASWDDFELLPALAMEVTCKVEEGVVTSIAPAKNASAPSAPQPTAPVSSMPLWEKGRRSIDKIRLSVSVKVCVDQYFKHIEEDIHERTGYRDAKYRLDFLKMRRFLFTMYNNLTELDLHFVTPKIKMMRDDLLQMSAVYDDYKSKATYPEIAFEKVFLVRQEEYVQVREESSLTFAKLAGLRDAEVKLAEIIAEKEAVLERTLRSSPVYDELSEEHKKLKSDYVDTVHMMATLDEIYHHDLELMLSFEQSYKEPFFEVFHAASKAYREQILTILDAQAYLFDEQLWMQAQKSKAIQRFFEHSHIQGDFSSKTYLKYYLNSLDPEKISSEQRELFKLYDYLESMTRDCVVAVAADMDEAFTLKSLFAQIALPIEAQVYVDTAKAFAWMQKHPVTLILVDEALRGVSAESFVRQVRDKIGSRAKTVLMGAKPLREGSVFDAQMPKALRATLFKERIQQFLKEMHG